MVVSHFSPVKEPGFKNVVVFLLCSGLVCCWAELNGVVAAQWSGDDRNRTLRHRTCLENQQYLHQGLCCLNCQAGTFVQRACDRNMEQGTCMPCEHGFTYTEHSNGMNRCLPCTHCRMGNGTRARQCPVPVQQTPSASVKLAPSACQSRPVSCKAGEEVVKKCTPISNTVCRKRDVSPTLHPTALPTPAPSSPETIGSDSCCDSSDIVKIAIGEVGEEVRPESRPLLQETQDGLIKASPPLGLGEDEDRGLGDSLPNTTSSSQTSLSALPTAGAASSGSSPRHSPSAQRLQPTARDDPLQNRLVSLLGDETSLKKSFDLFDECLDIRIHNKFFRYIGVNDNHIKMAESAPPGDKVYDLLKNWMQKEGLKADINALLQALLSLDQRRSAESIAFAAIQKGYYKHADTP
ncbi:unnamed protein product [Coregonus sp. 'balchen']|nr:unnamed protein product [Coregonus sp. 'balchen']